MEIKNRVAVYTAIMGDFDNINDPVVITPGIDYICFTDTGNLKSNVWKIIKVEKNFDNSRLQARMIKLNPHIFLKDYDYSIWVDGNIKILKNLSSTIEEFIIKNKKISTFKHFSRNCIYDEALYCALLKKSDCRSIYEQISFCVDQKYPTQHGLAETNVMLRKHHDKSVVECMEIWWECVSQRCIRDQLSFNYSVYITNINIDYLKGNARFDVDVFKCKEHGIKNVKDFFELIKIFIFKIRDKVGFFKAS